MNKQQYKAYRRNQRICYNDEYGYPDNRSEYFNRIELQQPLYNLNTPTQYIMAFWNSIKTGSNSADRVYMTRHRMKLNIQGGY